MHLLQWLSHTTTRSSLQSLELNMFGHESINHALARGFQCAAFCGQGLRTLTLQLHIDNGITSTCEDRLGRCISPLTLTRLTQMISSPLRHANH